MLFLSCFVMLHARLYIGILSSPAEKGLSSLGSRLRCLIVKLPLSLWYPGSGVVLDCIDS